MDRRGGLPDPPLGHDHGLTADNLDAGGNPVPLRLTLGLIRLTHAELHQKAVAHPGQTLASDYLGRNRGNLAEYREGRRGRLEGGGRQGPRPGRHDTPDRR